MAAHDDKSSGILRGHSVAYALIAIFVSMTLVVAYAASDGALFGQNFDSVQGLDQSMGNDSASGAAVISRDSFDQEEERVPAHQNADTTLPPNAANYNSSSESVTILSEEEMQLLSISDFSWDSIVEAYIASNQDTMDRFRRPVPVQPGAESISLSDTVLVNVDPVRERVVDEADEDLELSDVTDINIPIDITEEEEQPEEEQPEEEQPEEEQPPNIDDGQEEPNDNEDQAEDIDNDDSPSEGSEDNSGSEEEGDQSGSDNEGNSENSVETEDPSEDSDSDSSDNSTSVEPTA